MKILVLPCLPRFMDSHLQQRCLNLLLKKINKFFISKLAGVIVLGESHIEIFESLIEKNKISIIPNFAEDYLFVNKNDISAHFIQNSFKTRFLI